MIALNYEFLIVQAAGNDSMDAEFNGWFSAIDDEEVKKHIIIVGALKNSGDGEVSFDDRYSNYGKKTIDIVAPGTSIYSTVPFDNYTNEMSGTSWQLLT